MGEQPVEGAAGSVDARGPEGRECMPWWEVARRCAARAAVSRVLAARRRVPGGLRAPHEPVRQAAPVCHAPSSLRPAQLASVSRTGDTVHNNKKKSIL